MYVETMERDFHEKVSAKVRLSAEGVNRFRVLTPFLFDDGDHLSAPAGAHIPPPSLG